MPINNHPLQRESNPYHRPSGWKSISLGSGAYLQADFQADMARALGSARVVKRHRKGAICLKPSEHYGEANLSQFSRDLYTLLQAKETNSIY